LTTKELGELAKAVRKNLGLTQEDLALTCGVGPRFIAELERGKETCQIGKVLLVLATLGIKIEFKTSLQK
jgi:HTH-type transcriptional regulator / antitoxin HipB